MLPAARVLTSPIARRIALLPLVLSSACSAPPPAPAAVPTSAPSAAAAATAAPVAAAPDWSEKGVPRILSDAERLSSVVTSEGAKRFLGRARLLPRIAPRDLLREANTASFFKAYYTEAGAAALPAEARAKLAPFPVDEEVYYTTRYGSPLSYSRPLDILFSRGISLPRGARFLDFGYGYIAHLRMLASLGIDATGVDVNPLLPVLYSWPGDLGPVSGPDGEEGNLRIIDGHFPSDPKIVTQVGSGYDLILSKNTLKRGYIHPERPFDPQRLISLGVSDELAIKAFFDALAPGGWFFIYNICPAPTPPDKPYIPWSDGRSPFTKAQWEAGGFEVAVFDQDDTEAVRTMGRALGWDQPEEGQPGMDLVNDLSVLYTLVRRPAAR